MKNSRINHKFDLYEESFCCCPRDPHISGGSGFIASAKHETYKRICGIFIISGPIESDSAVDLLGCLP